MKPMHPLRGESATSHPCLAALATVSDAMGEGGGDADNSGQEGVGVKNYKFFADVLSF